MRVYHERFRVPAYWWPLALFLVVLFGVEVFAGLPLPLAGAGFAVLTAVTVVALLLSSRTVIEVRDGELRAGRSCLPLKCAGEVTALDEAQTRLLRGPRADPAAFVMTRPYLRRAVYIEVASPPPAPAAPLRGPWGRVRAMLGRRATSPAGGPYWLVGSRRPEELAAAIGKSRPVVRPGGVPVG